jgi:nucleoid DNA-binding protein
VRELLDDAVLSVAGFVLVNLRHRSTRARREPKTRAQVAEMVFRAVTEV